MTRPETTVQDRTALGRFRRLDLLSLTFGLLALGTAVIYLANDLDGRDVPLGGLVAFALGALAVVGLLAGVRGAYAHRDA